MNLEHVQPIESLTPRRRAVLRTWFAAAVPIAVLVAVVAAGVLGGGDGNDRPAVAVASAQPTPTVPSGLRPSEAPAVARADPPDGFPSDAVGAPILGIDAMDAAAVVRLARSGIDSDRLVAVAGWLTLAPDESACRRDWLLCRRTGLLADVPTVDGGGALFLETRPDMTVSGAHRPRQRPDSWSVASPAIVVGRFAPRLDRECGLRRPRCERVFTVELLAWLEGDGEAATPTGDATEGASRSSRQVQRTARAAIRGVGEVVGVTLVERARLPILEPAAADVAADGAGPVWLVRTVAFRSRRDIGSDPRVGWAVIDDATGAVLAAHPNHAGWLGPRP